jgi:hypothetical protein
MFRNSMMGGCGGNMYGGCGEMYGGCGMYGGGPGASGEPVDDTPFYSKTWFMVLMGAIIFIIVMVLSSYSSDSGTFEPEPTTTDPEKYRRGRERFRLPSNVRGCVDDVDLFATAMDLDNCGRPLGTIRKCKLMDPNTMAASEQRERDRRRNLKCPRR